MDRDEVVRGASAEPGTSTASKRGRSQTPDPDSLFVSETPSAPGRASKRPKVEETTPTPLTPAPTELSSSLQPRSPDQAAMQLDPPTFSETHEETAMQAETTSSSSVGDTATHPVADTLTSPKDAATMRLDQLALQYKSVDLPANCPRLASYHPLFAQAEQKLPDICHSLPREYERLKEAGFRNSAIESICKRLMHFGDLKKHWPKVQPVALIGQMGAGKSRTINSILDQPRIASDSDGADRGTNVVHEYLGPEHGQTAKYRIDAIYYSSEDVKAAVTKLVESIYRFMSMKNRDQDDEDDHDDDEIRDLESNCDNALDWFSVVLRERGEFATSDDARVFFDDHFHRSTTEVELVKILEGHLRDFKVSRHVIEDVESHVAHDERQLTQVFAKVSKPKSGDEDKAHPWPLIQKIQVRARDIAILKTGAVVADTPGTADSDPMIVNRTRMYLRNAGTVLIVSPLLRTQRMAELDDILDTCLRLGKAKDTYMVVTKIDQKELPQQDDVDNMQPTFREAYHAAKAEEGRLLEEQKAWNAKMDQLTEDPSPDIEELREANRRLRDLPALITEQQAAAFQAYIESRNSETSKLLEPKFRQISKSSRSPDLKTIFVSNTEYGLLATSQPARLDRAMTGIPTLQRIVYETPAADSFGVLRSICEEQVAATLRGVASSLTQTALEKKADVEHVLVTNLYELPKILEWLSKHIEYLFEECVEKVFVECEEHWKKKAKALILRWQGYHAGTFAAFCRRSGEWKPNKKSEKIKWNKLIHEVFADDVSKGIEIFRTRFEEALGVAKSDMGDIFGKLEKALQACPAFQGVSETEQGQEFYAELRRARDKTQSSIEKRIESLGQKLGDINLDMILTTDATDSFVDVAMESAYEEAQLVTPVTSGNSRRKKGKKKGASAAHQGRVKVIEWKLTGNSRAPDVQESDMERPGENERGGEITAPLNIYQAVLHLAKAELAQVLRDSTMLAKGMLENKSQGIVKYFNDRFGDEEEIAQDPVATELLIATAARDLKNLEEGPVQWLKVCKKWEDDNNDAVMTF